MIQKLVKRVMIFGMRMKFLPIMFNVLKAVLIILILVMELSIVRKLRHTMNMSIRLSTIFLHVIFRMVRSMVLISLSIKKFQDVLMNAVKLKQLHSLSIILV